MKQQHSRLVTVHNLSTNDKVLFDQSLPRSYMVAYAYAEETNQLSRLFSLRKENESVVRDEVIRAAFPITDGTLSIGCGDWATMRQTS